MTRRILCLFLAVITLSCPSATVSLADAEPASEASPADSAPPAASAEPTAGSPTVSPEPAGSWLEKDGDVYYLDADGVPVTGWQQIDGQTYYFRPSGRRAEGWVGIEGKRYYFGADGLAYTGLRYAESPTGTYGMYLFSDDGVRQESGHVTLLGKEYTIGDDGIIQGYATEVSPKAAAVLDEIGWDLRAAFNWSAGLTYYGRETRAPEGVVHSEWYADYGFTNKYGNCFVMAATFYQMAKLLGCEVYFIEGYVGAAAGGVIPHSWTEIVIDGDVYVFDPDFTNEEGIDGFQIWYEKPNTWWYYGYERVD